jgi:hypothetical protein
LVRSEIFQPPEARLNLHGSFQRFDLIAEERCRIREQWLRFDAPAPHRPVGELVICCDFRYETSTNSAGAFTETQIRRLIRTVAHDRLWIVAEDLCHPIVTILREFGGEVASLCGADQLQFIRSFQKIAISQSALHWWGAFLSEAKEIYFPKIDCGPWSHPEPAKFAHDPAHYGIDLRVTDEDRWIYDW